MSRKPIPCRHFAGVSPRSGCGIEFAKERPVAAKASPGGFARRTGGTLMTSKVGIAPISHFTAAVSPCAAARPEGSMNLFRSSYRSRFPLALLLLALAAVGCSGGGGGSPTEPGARPTPAPTPSPAQYAGTWSGTTGTGRSVRMVVNDAGMVESLRVEVRLDFPTFTCTGPLLLNNPVQISGNTFNAQVTFPNSNITTTINGTFSSTSAVSGMHGEKSGAFSLTCGNRFTTGTTGSTFLRSDSWSATKGTS